VYVTGGFRADVRQAISGRRPLRTGDSRVFVDFRQYTPIICGDNPDQRSRAAFCFISPGVLVRYQAPARMETHMADRTQAVQVLRQDLLVAGT
jgi:hypothetical protein